MERKTGHIGTRSFRSGGLEIISGSIFSNQPIPATERPTLDKLREIVDELSGDVTYTPAYNTVQWRLCEANNECTAPNELYDSLLKFPSPYKPLVYREPIEEPDLTMADKEWIDKIDGHSLRVEDLY
jgi:hypothetical protein